MSAPDEPLNDLYDQLESLQQTVLGLDSSATTARWPCATKSRLPVTSLTYAVIR